MTAAFDRVAVLGLGLIGGSLLRALRDIDVDVIGYDIDSATAAAASASGFAVAASDDHAVAGADLVVLAMPLPSVGAALASVGPHLAAGTLLTDVGTLKTPIHALVRQVAPQVRFVGGHPLAGTEESGWRATDPLLFRDAPWTLTLEPETDVADWLRVAQLVCDLGARAVPATAAEQDAAVARVIGLPHILAEALALVGLDGGPLGLSLAAGSYLSGSRVARTRPDLVATWCDGNPALITALDEVLARLSAARDRLRAGDSMYELAEAGYRARTGWEQRRFVTVDVPATADALREHGRDGGWVTAVRRDGDAVQLLGMRPAP